MILDVIREKIVPEEYNNFETVYNYEGVPVPRVTNILSSMLHEDGLMVWSNNIGKQGCDYKKTLNLAAEKGTYVHNAIEDYIQNGNTLDMSSVDSFCTKDVYRAYNSFLSWWNIIKDNIEVLMQEVPLVGKYFAGTLDLLIKFNNRIYLLDFKTSNHISYKYFLQLSAYRYLLKELYNIEINGCGIIMLNKKEIAYNETILDFANEYDLYFMNQCEETFFSLVYGFYNRMRVESMFATVMENKEMVDDNNVDINL